ncbi:oligogalacturonate-specific porin KdgM family protein [Vibrio agarivorans]|uniref:Oligogalacturonate-specific porin KdgM family protein n=1 Tax=Vibrio agarivorans TaxID=153622 RepID=A0ABT7Y5Q9_9VIBR|nr:oligogalacturonate-specific porin KdgM family protein [Vibrio agarivorans]MDN2483330.1 oligogalacturonate-specific porin KdgM family protein [Vibrio agarivorans]
MKAVTTIAAIVSATLLAGAASAATLDYRAEYKHDDEKYAHRIKISGGKKLSDTVKLNFGVEQKFQSLDQTNFWDQVSAGDSEFSWDVRYALNDQWYLQPGMPITFADDSEKTTYKPQLRVGYKSSFGLTTALRYRHEFQVYTDDAGTKTLTDGTKVSVAGKTVEQGKWTLTGSYKFKDKEWQKLKLGYEINYNKNYDEVRLDNNKDYDWDAGVIVGYQMGDFRPYVELWSVKAGGSTDDERQLRTRLGLKYSF